MKLNEPFTLGLLYGSGLFHKMPLYLVIVHLFISALFLCFSDTFFQVNDTTFQLVLLMGVASHQRM